MCRLSTRTRKENHSLSESEQVWEFEWKPFGFATFNALTMESIRGSKRVLDQFRAANCQVVFFQETRRKFEAPNRVTVEDDWFLVQSRATPEGKGGCAIGIDLKRVLGQIGTKDVGSTNAVPGPTTRRIKKLSVTPDQVNVLHADERVLAITVNLVGRVIGFASLHAPDTTKGVVTNEWWCNACAILRRFPVGVTPWIGIDANVALPEVWYAATVKGHEAPVRCSVSARRAAVLRELAAVHGHRVLGEQTEDSDFREIQQHFTFVARGCSSICDYLLAPPTAKIVPRSLTTLPSFGGLSRSDDHLPVICHVSFGGDTGSHPTPLRFVCPYDRTGWRDMSKAHHFCHLLSRVPVPSYAGSPTDHVASVEIAIREAAVEAFPKSKRAKVQGNASDPLFQLIVQRGRLKARRRGLGRLLNWFENRSCLDHTFHSWCALTRLPSADVVCACEGDLSRYRGACSDMLFCELAISDLSSRIGDALAREAHEAIQKITDAIYEATNGPSPTGIFSVLRPLYQTNQGGAKVVYQENGLLTTSLLETKTVFAQKFAGMLGGGAVESLAALAREHPQFYRDFKCEDANLELLPSYLDTLRLLRKAAPGRGLGPDAIGGELLKSGAVQICRLIYPVLMKTVTQISPPLQWKGGLMFELFKKGDHFQPDCYREITCVSPLAKLLTRPLRKHVVPVLKNLAGASQFGGGLNGGGCDFTRLRLTVAMEAANLTKLSCGALFVDLSAAFSSITRHLVFPVSDSMDNLFSRLCECGYVDDEATEILEGLTAYSYWEQSGGSKHLLALIGKLHIGSWFSLRPLTTIFESCRGALAGSSLGDVLFLLGFARVMNRISSALENQGLVKSIPLSEEACAILPAGFEERFPGCRVPLCSSQYMDDVVFPVVGEAGKIVELVAATAAVVYGEFHRHLLRMNMKQGKSEALIVFGGRGCKDAENILFRDNGGIIPFEYRGVRHALFATRVYKHVGTQSCVSGSLAPELKSRLASMQGVSTSLGRYFFRRPQMPIASKLLVARALLLSKGLFSAGTWPTLNASEHKKLHQALMKVFGGCIVPGWHNKMYSFTAAHREHQIAAPIHLVRQLRLGLFRRVCERAPDDLLPLLVSGCKAKRSWFSAVVDDLRMFARHFLPMAHFLEASIPEIIAFVRASPRGFSRNVANALKDVDFNHPSVWSCPAVDEILSAWSCGDCDEVFLSARALSSHRFMQHGVKLTCRDKLTETHCPVCLNEFHTRARLVVHISRASPICNSVLEEHYGPEPPELVLQAEEMSKQQDREFRRMGRHRTWAEFPSFRREGPLTLAAIEAGITHGTQRCR